MITVGYIKVKGTSHIVKFDFNNRYCIGFRDEFSGLIFLLGGLFIIVGILILTSYSL